MPENSIYNQSYVERYLLSALNSPYTKYKNQQIVEEAVCESPPYVLDIGGNVHGVVKSPPSLRYLLEEVGIKYIGLDLSLAFFKPPVGLKRSKIYSEVNGVVGDATFLPFSNQSIPFVVCADVLEHVPNPLKALQEISRILKNDGRAIVIIPSMYKLDGIQYEHIEEIRPSTHCNKLRLSQWLNLCKRAGLTPTERSRALGIMSGLSYLMWLDDSFVPERQTPETEPTYSPNARVHKELKKIFSYIDPLVDQYLQQNPNVKTEILDLLLKGEIGELFNLMRNIAIDFLPDSNQIQRILDGFNRFIAMPIPRKRITQLVETLKEQKDNVPDNIFLGNSALLVLKKQ